MLPSPIAGARISNQVLIILDFAGRLALAPFMHGIEKCRTEASARGLLPSVLRRGGRRRSIGARSSRAARRKGSGRAQIVRHEKATTGQR